MNNMKTNFKNTKFNFSKNIITSIVIPAVLLVTAIIMGIILGFNKGIDFNGGILVSVTAENQNLEVTQEYNSFVNDVNTILNENGVSGAVYMVEKDSISYNDVLVVKIEYTGSAEESEALINAIKTDLISKFYSEVSESQIELRNLVNVSTFGASVDVWNIVATLLATIVAVALICIYVGLRADVHTAMYALVSSFGASLLATALVMASRIQVNASSLAIIPFVSILSVMVTYLFMKNAMALIKTGNYERKSNFVVANDATKNSLTKVISIGGIAVLASLLFALLNITSPVVYLGLTVLAGIISVIYTNLFIIPAIFGLTYVRKVKKEKQKKSEQTAKLDEAEVMKETDLDNLVSN